MLLCLGSVGNERVWEVLRGRCRMRVGSVVNGGYNLVLIDSFQKTGKKGSAREKVGNGR